MNIYELKGKRSKNIPINILEKLEICIRVKEEIQDNERVCKIKEGSINAEVKRILVKNKRLCFKMILIIESIKVDKLIYPLLICNILTLLIKLFIDFII